MNYLVSGYLAYGLAAFALTVWLARTLFRNGAVFLRDVFDDNPAIADAVNRLLVTGFFMVNLGYAFFSLRSSEAPDAVAAIEVFARKFGVLLLTLAVVHFINVAVFWRLRRRNEVQHLAPPVAPQARIVPAPTVG